MDERAVSVVGPCRVSVGALQGACPHVITACGLPPGEHTYLCLRSSALYALPVAEAMHMNTKQYCTASSPLSDRFDQELHHHAAANPGIARQFGSVSRFSLALSATVETRSMTEPSSTTRVTSALPPFAMAAS